MALQHHFSELPFPFNTRTDNGVLAPGLFRAFIGELRSKGLGGGEWYDFEETDDSNAPE
jgi:hypothetical protein